MTLNWAHLAAGLLLCSYGFDAHSSYGVEQPKIQQGKIDVSTWNFEQQGSLELKGEWKASWDQVALQEPTNWIQLPGTIPNDVPSTAWREGFGNAAFGFTITGLSPNKNYSILLGHQDIPTEIECKNPQGATVEAIPSLQLPQKEQAILTLNLPQTASADCTLKVRKTNITGGRGEFIRSVPKIGLHHQIRNAASQDSFIKSSTFGSLLTSSLFFLAYFFGRRKDRFAGLVGFGLLALTAWYMGYTGNWEALNLLDPLIRKRIEYGALSLGHFFLLAISINVRDRLSLWDKLIAGAMSLLGILFFLSPAEHLYILTRSVLQPLLLVMLLRQLFLGTHGVFQKNSSIESRLISISFFISPVFGLADLYRARMSYSNLGLVAYSLAATGFSITIIFAVRYARSFTRLEVFADVSKKFLPTQFLETLGHKDFTSAKLGDAKSIEMTIFFADIRNFTERSEKMAPEEIFQFLNQCLSQMGPVVRAHHGFIDKYIGDAVMALFPGGANDAIRATLGMQEVIDRINTENPNQAKLSIGMGVGVAPSIPDHLAG